MDVHNTGPGQEDVTLRYRKGDTIEDFSIKIWNDAAFTDPFDFTGETDFDLFIWKTDKRTELLKTLAKDAGTPDQITRTTNDFLASWTEAFLALPISSYNWAIVWQKAGNEPETVVSGPFIVF